MSRQITFSGKITKIEKPEYAHRVAGTQRMVYQFDLVHMPKIKAEDYLFCRVRACSADVPNRNGDCFPYDELKKAYVTFIGKGVFTDHNADSVNDMKGIILDAVFKETPEHGAWVELLLAVDKANKSLCRKIAKGQITDVSMGCIVREGVCSICGNICRGKQDEYGNVIDACAHLERKGADWNGRLIYEECRGVEFIEISFVTDGADVEALILDSNIVLAEELPTDVMNYVALNSQDELIVGQRRSASTKRINHSYTLVYELPTEIASSVFDLCRHASPENYWNVYEKIQQYPLNRAMYYLKGLSANRLADFEKLAESRNLTASVDYILSVTDGPLIEQLAEEYVQNYAVDLKDPTIVSSALAYVLGKFEELINEDNVGGEPLAVYDMNGIATSIVQDTVDQKLQVAASKKQPMLRKAASKKVKNLSELVAKQSLFITDSEYGFLDTPATVHTSLAVSPSITIVDWVEVLAEVGDSLKLAKIYQADIDRGISEIYTE